MACMTYLKPWHNRLGHVCDTDISDMNLHNSVSHINVCNGKENWPCTTCAEHKHTITEISRITADRQFTVLRAVHTEVCGPMEARSMGEAHYFVTSIDKGFHWNEICPIRIWLDVFEYSNGYMAQPSDGRGENWNLCTQIAAKSF